MDTGSVVWRASDRRGTRATPLSPKLSALANNGGPTRTAVIGTSCPAYNAGSNALAVTFGLTTDQRGHPRVRFGTVDVGAFEY